MCDRANVLRELQHAFSTGAARQQAGHFESLISHAESTGLILTLAALLADRSRCLDDLSRLACEWARHAVESMAPVDIMASRRKLLRERSRLDGVLAVLDALATRQESQPTSAGQPQEGIQMILRLRHRASLQLLSLQHMASLPESMRQAASDRMISGSESNINEILGMREQDLRKAGLPLMHDKLAEVFVRTSAIAAGHRGAQHVIAALVETLQHAREKWLEDTVRGGAGLKSWSHEVDHEQLSREGGYERAALVCLLYYAAQHYLVEGAADNDHQRLVLQEQQVDNLRVALSGTPDDTAVALALFWLDATEMPSHMQKAALFLCRPGVPAEMGSLHMSSWCQRFLTLPGFLSHAHSSVCSAGCVASVGLEACRVLVQGDGGHLSVQDVGAYVLALVSASPHSTALQHALDAAHSRLALIVRVATHAADRYEGLFSAPPPRTAAAAPQQQQQRVEQQVLAALRKAGVEDVGVDLVGVSRAQGLWEPMCVRSGQQSASAAGAQSHVDSMQEQREGVVGREAMYLKVRVANEHGMAQAVNQLRAFSAARLEFFGEHGGACTITSVSDGNKALEEWRQLLRLVVAAVLAAMPSPNARAAASQLAGGLAAASDAPDSTEPVLLAPLHKFLERRMSAAAEAVVSDFLAAPLAAMEQVHRTFVLTAAPDTQYAAQLRRVMEACKDKCGRSSGHYEAHVLRDLVFRRYGFAALHMEQLRQDRVRAGGGADGASSSLLAHVSCTLGHSSNAADEYETGGALPYVQVQRPLQSVRKQSGSSAPSSGGTLYPEPALQEDTVLGLDRRASGGSAAVLAAHTPMLNKFSALTPHRLIARQSSTLMLGQPSPYQPPWLRSAESTPLTQFSGAKRTADGSTIDLSMEMDDEVTFGHGRSKYLLGATSAHSPSPAPSPAARITFGGDASTYSHFSASFSGAKRPQAGAVSLLKQAAAGASSFSSPRSTRQQSRMSRNNRI